MRATITFEIENEGLTEPELKEKMLEHIVEVMDNFLQGEMMLTIEFDNTENEQITRHNDLHCD